MTKADLISRVQKTTGLTVAQSRIFVNAFLAIVTDELAAGNEIPLPGFGKFSTKARGERRGRNLRTGAAITIPACKVAVFRPAKALKDAIQ